MSSVIVELPDEGSTIELGKRIAKLIQPGSVLFLEGELGVGKTSLCRGIILGLGGKSKQVTSPTFTLVNEYEAKNSSTHSSLIVHHCDFTRLPEGDLLDDFGGLEFFTTKNIYVVEWFSRLGISEKNLKNHIVMVEILYKGSGRLAKITDNARKDLKFLE